MDNPFPECPNCDGDGYYYAMEWEGGRKRGCPCTYNPGVLVAIILENFFEAVDMRTKLDARKQGAGDDQPA